MPFRFSSQDIRFSLKRKNIIKKIIQSVFQKEKKQIEEVGFIFCSDKFLLALNKKFLRHNTLTDVITFQYASEKISAEIFISIPRVKENAKQFGAPFEYELHRVMIHGILHLCGYNDKMKRDKTEMRKKEDYYLKQAWNK